MTPSDVRRVLEAYISRALAPLSAGVSRQMVERAAALQPSQWNSRFQIVGGRAYLVGTPRLINHHHRKRLKGVQQILRALQETSSAIADVDFVLNLGDAPKVRPLPHEH